MLPPKFADKDKITKSTGLPIKRTPKADLVQKFFILASDKSIMIKFNHTTFGIRKIDGTLQSRSEGVDNAHDNKLISLIQGIIRKNMREQMPVEQIAEHLNKGINATSIRVFYNMIAKPVEEFEISNAPQAIIKEDINTLAAAKYLK